MAEGTPTYVGFAGVEAIKKFIEDTVHDVSVPDASETEKGAVRLMTYDETLALLQQWEEEVNA